MKRPTLWIVITATLFLTAGLQAAEPNSQNNQKGPGEVIRPAVSDKAGPNELPRTALPQQTTREQIEQVRRQSRERIQQRAKERRSRIIDGNRMPRDVNAGIPGNRIVRSPMNPAEVQKQQMQAIEQMLAGEETKHRDRVARLERIRELAQQQGDIETVARADQLLEKEKKLYEMKIQRMNLRRERIETFPGNAPPAGMRMPNREKPGRDVNRAPAGNK